MKGNIYKLVSLILIILMMFVSAACDAAAPTEPEETPSVTPEEPGTPDFIIIEPPPAA